MKVTPANTLSEKKEVNHSKRAFGDRGDSALNNLSYFILAFWQM